MVSILKLPNVYKRKIYDKTSKKKRTSPVIKAIKSQYFAA